MARPGLLDRLDLSVRAGVQRSVLVEVAVSKIQSALNAAMRDIARIGIAKLGSAKLGAATVRFRGVEQAMNEMSPIMVNHGITVAAKYSELVVQERAKAEEGKATRFVTLKGAFTFSAEDDSSVTSEAYGEAMDSGDKATIKAQSVAFRTALFQLFVVPTMSMDTELDDHEEAAAGEETELDAYRAESLKGWAALKAYCEAKNPAEAFWMRHGPALKEAAKKADADSKARA
jgi:hypothetical protein